MSNQFHLKSGCKINLNLKILDARPDGYHDIDSIFYPLEHPADHIDVIVTRNNSLSMKCCPPELENNQNIVFRAYEKFALATGFRPGMKVYLQKQVPVGAGLGGGSANAAVMLKLLNRLAKGRRLSRARLTDLASEIGGDVPFFLANVPAQVTGMGERLSPVKVDLTGLKMLLICPGIHIDTGWAYGQWDLLKKNISDDQTIGLTSRPSKDKGSPLEEQLVLSNNFESVIFRFYPELAKIKTMMLKNGASACVMSGSGSSLLALFRHQDQVFESCTELKTQSLPFYFYNF